MFRSAEPEASSRPIDWRALILLGWMVLIGALYAAMIVERKAPILAADIHARFGR